MSGISPKVTAALATAALLIAHALYGRELYFLCDDAYITFRYANNFALGRGLVWNVGEYVEGYTNFLWTLLMALSIRLHISPELSAPVLSVLCSLACLGLLVPAARRMAPAWSSGAPVALIALGLLAFHRSWNVWATGGLETRFFTLLIFAGVLGMLFGSRRWRPAGATLMGLAALTRPDGLLLFGMCGIALVIEERRELLAFTRERTLPALRSLTLTALPFFVITGSHLLFRLYYYGRPLPNTYYAKVDAPWPEMGVLFLTAFVLEYGLVFWLLGGTLLLLFARRLGITDEERGPTRLYLYVLLIFAPHCIYYAYKVGGDHFEYRIFDAYLPFLALFMAHALLLFWTWAGRAVRRAWARHGLRIGVTAYLLLMSVFIPNWKVFVPAGTPFGLSGVPVEQADHLARFYFFAPFLRSSFATWKEAQLKLQHHQIAVRMEAHRDFWDWRAGQMRPFAGAEFPPGSVTEDGGIGILGYFVDIPVIDRLGLTDRVVAESRVPLAKDPDKRMIAHNRSATKEYLLERGFTLYVHCRVSRLTAVPAEIERDCPDGYRTLPSGDAPDEVYVARWKDLFFVFSTPPHFATATRDWIARTFPPDDVLPVNMPIK